MQIKQQRIIQKLILIFIGSAILALGLCHVHAQADVTEGGVLGLTLLFYHHFGLSPALTGLLLNLFCYLLGWKTLGKKFLLYSAAAGSGFSVFYAVFEHLPPVFPHIGEHPLKAAVLGAVFVGVGVGLCVLAGGAPSGDDALAMSLSHLIRCNIAWVYLVSDLAVLLLSLTYIPPRRILYSLFTVVLSGQIIGWIQKIRIQSDPVKSKQK